MDVNRPAEPAELGYEIFTEELALDLR
jgi:hypothetical protein